MSAAAGPSSYFALLAPRSSIRGATLRTETPNRKPKADREPARYDLRTSQISTPIPVVRFFWQLVKTYRPQLARVLDLGAADGRFAKYGHYEKYLGIEIDAGKISSRKIHARAEIREGCAFANRAQQFDACIGNPPYLRHHEIESPWKETTLGYLSSQLNTILSGQTNLFVYFMALGLVKTKTDGIVAMLVPFDWVSRPSAAGLRHAIRNQQWSVHVYRFSSPIFTDVETTASISIIDKSDKSGSWQFYNVSDSFSVSKRRGVTGTGKTLLQYSTRAQAFARRGISPGSQKIFVLTEGERIHHGLQRSDVRPCLTTLRGLDPAIGSITATTFERLFVQAGRRCWLINSRGKINDRLARYLGGIKESERSTSTCLRQDPWYKYEDIDVPPMLLHSAFTTGEPHLVLNSVGAIPAGSMYGIYGVPRSKAAKLRSLIKINVRSRIVPHSGRLRKIEVGQLNGLLSQFNREGFLGD